jgi:hypothetical protein
MHAETILSVRAKSNSDPLKYDVSVLRPIMKGYGEAYLSITPGRTWPSSLQFARVMPHPLFFAHSTAAPYSLP